MEWTSNRRLFFEALSVLMHEQKIPKVQCCTNPDPHFFFYRYRENRGSAWAWCSNCRSYVHFDGCEIPNNWNNPEELPLSVLSAVPIVLEEKKDIADKAIADMCK